MSVRHLAQWKRNPRQLGRPYPFEARPWPDIADFLGRYDVPEFRHMTDVVESVILSGSTGLLAACTSMFDLIVVPTPLPEPPYGAIFVRAPGPLSRPAVRPGTVRVEHRSTTGYDDRIDRPVADAVPLFWRFVWEKFGVLPVNPP